MNTQIARASTSVCPKDRLKISRTSGLRIFNLQSSIQDVLARASTSWIALSTYLDNFGKSCQRIFNLEILDCPKCGFEESKRQTGSAPCRNQIADVRLHCLHVARKKNVVDIFTGFLWT